MAERRKFSLDNDKNRTAESPRGKADQRSNGTAASIFELKRIGLAFGIIILFFVLLVLRVGYWQIVRADDLRIKATEMQKQDVEIEPIRGNIYDSKMKPLAQTVTEYELYGYTSELYKSSNLKEGEKTRNIEKIAELTGRDKEEIKKQLSGKDNLVKLGEGLDRKKVKTAKKLWNDGVIIKTKVTRSYPNNVFASQLLGSVNDDNNGRTGLEYQYNDVLSGVKGRAVRTTDSQGNTLVGGNSRYYHPKNGESVQTTIDEVIQHYAEDAVAKGMKDTGAESITCIVMDPKTGNVLAMVTNPSFDPNRANAPTDSAELASFKKMSAKDQNEYLSRMWSNPAISKAYEPGSTFKLITASSALDCGSANDNSRYYCSGSFNVDGTTLHCWYTAGHGSENLEQAVGNSCNAALARVALDMGADNFYKYIRLYGFMSQTGIDLPGEGYSIVKDKATLGRVDLATLGYGHGIAITPIQLLTAVNIMGNDGVLMKPKVVSRIVDKNGRTVKRFKDVRVRQVIAKETSDEMREIMEYYVKGSGGNTAYIPGYRVGGKTGTAFIPKGGSYTNDTVQSFVAMAPMNDPKVSILVVVNSAKKSSFGAASAGPIVKSVLEKTLVYMGVPKEYTDAEKVSINKAEVTVPNLTGMNSGEAIKKIGSLGLTYKCIPEGSSNFYVLDQYPKADETATKGSTVYLYSE